MSRLIHNRFAERLGPDDAALLIVDPQTPLIDRIAGASAAVLREDLMGLALVGHAFNLPTVIGARGTKAGERTSRPVEPELLSLFGPDAVIRREAAAFFDDARSREAVLKTGRRHLLLAVLSETDDLSAAALAAGAAGFEVHAVIDASHCPALPGGRAAMEAAGIDLIGWVAVLAELAAMARRRLDRDPTPPSVAQHLTRVMGRPRLKPAYH